VGRSLWLGVFIACVVVAAMASHRDVTADPASSGGSGSPLPEATADQPPPGVATPFDPFTLHDVGPPGRVWQYEDLSADEQAVVDLGFETDAWGDAQQVLAAAAAQQFPAIAARRAQLLLGVSDLANAGVVP